MAPPFQFYLKYEIPPPEDLEPWKYYILSAKFPRMFGTPCKISWYPVVRVLEYLVYHAKYP